MKCLITGASSGIGKHMAYYLASKNIDLILVARNTKEMEKIKENVQVDVKIISLDLTNTKNVFKLYEQTKDDNIVVFPNGNWVTNLMYYNSQKGEYKLLKDEIIDENYIKDNNEYTEKLLDISNKAIVFDLFNPNSEESVSKEK